MTRTNQLTNRRYGTYYRKKKAKILRKYFLRKRFHKVKYSHHVKRMHLKKCIEDISFSKKKTAYKLC